MIHEASITGLLRTLLILVGALVLLRFLGQLMNAKRNMEEERELNSKQRKFDQEREVKKRTMGQTRVLSKSPGNQRNDIEDVDFEEID